AFAEGCFIFDVSEPTKPRRIGHFQTGSTGTHRNFYGGGNFIHAAAGAPGMAGKIYRIVDIADSAKPREVGQFSLPEQASGAATSGLKFFFYCPRHIQGTRAYLPYCACGAII